MVRRKIDRLYFALQEREVVTTDELHEVAEDLFGRKFSTQHLNSVYLKPLEEEGLLERPRRGLYVVKGQGERFQANPYLVASKVRDTYYLGYNTALEVHGAAHSDSASKYIVVQANDKFETFEYQDHRFQAIINRTLEPAAGRDLESDGPNGDTGQRILGLETVHHQGKPVRVSTPSRTFVDCVDRPTLSGGWEYCLKSLVRLRGVDPEEVHQVLDRYDNQTLLRKVGFLLELFSNRSLYYGDVTVSDLEAIADEVKDYRVYLDKERKNVFRPRWNLYVPERFEDHLEGV